MKKTIILHLFFIPFILFSQKPNQEELIKRTIDSIQRSLLIDYVKKHNPILEKKIKNSTDVWKFINQNYSNNHKVKQTWINLNFLYKDYKNNNSDINKFIKKGVETSVEYDYDKDKINSIIDRLINTNTYKVNKPNDTKNTAEPTQQNNQNQQTKNIINNYPPELNDNAENENSIYQLKKENERLRSLSQLLITLASIGIAFTIFFLFTNKSKESKMNKKTKLAGKNRSDNTDNLINNIEEEKQNSKTKENESETKKTIEEKKADEDKSALKKESNWLIVHTSEVGKSHLKTIPPIPCQDNHFVLEMENDWGIAVSCDGAGSAKLSHVGSKFVSQQAAQLFEKIIIQKQWISKGILPEPSEWEDISLKAMKKLRYDIEKYAEAEKISSSDLATTIIVLIYSPIGILSTHIGDGRAGYRDKDGKWEAIITPHKGEEANQTIFITSNHWFSGNFEVSGVKVPESRVVKSQITAFTLMSDGFETHSFETGYFDNKKQKFIKLNRPYTKFFEGIIDTLKKMYAEGKSIKEINDSWAYFVKEGSEQIKNEPDDKTIIIGVKKD